MYQRGHLPRNRHSSAYRDISVYAVKVRRLYAHRKWSFWLCVIRPCRHSVMQVVKVHGAYAKAWKGIEPRRRVQTSHNPNCSNLNLRCWSCSLKGYKEIMDGAADLLVEEVKEHVEGKEKYFNIYPMIQAMTMDVIGQTGFGWVTNKPPLF